jgi:hypothetical protein
VITNAVTLLSNKWQDAGMGTAYASGNQTNSSLGNPLNPNTSRGSTPNRLASTTWYRVAIASGGTIAFDAASGTPDSYFGSDGSVHNFLRQLEDWTVPGGASQRQLYHRDSIVSLYCNAYATGMWKCCNLVSHPPDRQYTFDDLFLIPQNLPRGTPMFRNVDNLSYRQNMIARQN